MVILSVEGTTDSPLFILDKDHSLVDPLPIYPSFGPEINSIESQCDFLAGKYLYTVTSDVLKYYCISRLDGKRHSGTLLKLDAGQTAIVPLGKTAFIAKGNLTTASGNVLSGPSALNAVNKDISFTANSRLFGVIM